MLKRNLTLGLLVFMVGVLITACGSKNNTNNNSDKKTTEVPTSFDDGICENCTKTINGTFRISDGDLYMQAFGHQSGSDIPFGGGSIFEQILGNIATSILEPAAGVAVCAGQIWLTEKIAKLAGINDFENECTVENLSLFGNNDDYNDNYNNKLNSSYPARLVVEYRDSRAERIGLEINSGINNNGTDREIFYYDRSNIFINQENSLVISNSSGRVRFSTTNGRVIGEFRH